MSSIEIDNYMRKRLENFRESLAELFEYNPELWEDIQTESEERLILDSLLYANRYLIETKKEINQA